MAPSVRAGASTRQASSMKERSGLPSLRGVGTLTTATSNPPRSAGSLVAEYRHVAIAACSRSSEMSSTGDTPALMPSTLALKTS